MRRSLHAALFLLLVAPVVANAQALFSNVTSAAGLSNFTSSTGDGHGPGAVFTDLNNDGYADIYMMKAFGGANRMFVNTPGAGGSRTFVRATSDAGAGDTRWSTGAVAADYDNDGDTDLYVLNFDQSVDPDFPNPGDPNPKNRLYSNQLAQTGQFTYIDVTASTDPTPGVIDNQYGVGTARHNGQWLDKSLTAAWADPDRDGDLDLYVGNHHLYFGDAQVTPTNLPGQRDIFYRNNGDGTFDDATMEIGVPGYVSSSGQHETSVQTFSSSNAVIFADFNNDQWPDLFVTNNGGGPPDYDMLYINQGANEQGEWLGYETVTFSLPNTFGNRSGAAMGVSVGDADNDGDLDIYITDWSNPVIYPNGGNNDLWINQLSDTGQLDFLPSNQLPAVFSWGTQWEDLDNNGYQDLHVATDALGIHNAPDHLYMNGPDGFTGDVAAAAELDQHDNARGDVSADFNRDGLLDLLVINPYDGDSALFENRSDEVSPNNHFLVLKLEGDPTLPGQFKSSRDAIGARVQIVADLDGDGQIEPGELLTREVASGSSNAASTSSLELEFGLGLATSAEATILWPSGREMQLDLSADQQLIVSEIAGDYNGDGLVNGLDYFEWRDTFGQTGLPGAGADGNGDGVVDAADYTMMRDHLGASAVGQFGLTSASATNPTPEPSTLILFTIAYCSLVSRRYLI
jgi:hypothetical protein